MKDEPPANTPALTPDLRSLEQRLARRPQVLARLHRLADLMDHAIVQGATADEAEARAIEQIRLLGRELLEDWAQEKQTHSLAQAQVEYPQAIKHVKKK